MITLNDPTARITDIWFRTPLSLREIATQLELRDFHEDSENYWAWVIGTFGGARLDITRTHTRKRSKADVRIFLLDEDHFTEALLDRLSARLAEFVSASVFFGRWEYRSGNDFEQVVVRTLETG